MRAGWLLNATVNGRVANVTNATLANLAGEPIRVGGAISLGRNAPLTFGNVAIDAAKLRMALNGTITRGETAIAGTGTHVRYGDFAVEATLASDGPRAVLVFADPFPAAGLRDVRVALAPIENGFRIDTEGGLATRSVRRRARSVRTGRWPDPACHRPVQCLENLPHR